jgi:hypothetical protein
VIHLRWNSGRPSIGRVDPSIVITQKEPLEGAPEMDRTVRDESDGRIPVALGPGMAA